MNQYIIEQLKIDKITLNNNINSIYHKMNKHVVVLRGSFNPITKMHIECLNLAKQEILKKDKNAIIKGVIMPVNDFYKKKDLISIVHRLELCKIAIRNIEWINVDDIEQSKDYHMKTIEMLNYMHEKYKCNVKLVFGSDILPLITKNNNVNYTELDTIINNFGVIVINRDEQYIDVYNKLSESTKQNILLINQKTDIPISSTIVREKIKSLQEIDYYADPNIYEYINKHNLYR